MKHRIANILKRLWEPVIGAAGIVPLGCLLFARFVPVLLPLAWVYPILYGIILFVYQQVPGKFRRTVIITGMGLLLAMGIIFLIRHTYFCVMAVPFFTAVLLFIQSMEGGFSIQSYLCAGLHLIWMIVLALNRRTEYFYYESVETGLSISFFVFLFLSMLALRRDNLSEISLGKLTLPPFMQKQSLGMILVLFFGTLLLALVPMVGVGVLQLLRFLFYILKTILGLLMKLLSGEESETPEMQPQVPEDSDFIIEQGPVIVFSFENILVVLLVIFVTAVTGFVLYLSCRRFFSRLKEILLHMNDESSDKDLGFEDEITETKPKKKSAEKRNRAKRRITADKNLSPELQIRTRYQKLQKKHRDWSPGSTARDHLPEDAAILYERARYSAHAVTEEDAREFHRKTRNR